MPALPPDSFLFIGILAVGSVLVYYTLRTVWKVLYWGIAVGIAYTLMKMFVIGKMI